MSKILIPGSAIPHAVVDQIDQSWYTLLDCDDSYCQGLENRSIISTPGKAGWKEQKPPTWQNHQHGKTVPVGNWVCLIKGTFSLYWASSPPRIGCSLYLIWCQTLDQRPLFTPNRSVHPDYFGANRWCRTCVSGNGNHSLLITSKESQIAIQFFH